MKVFAASAVIVAAFAGAIGGSYALGIHALDTSQHQWCSTLTLLTEHPVAKPADPQANPSRVNAYEFYTGLVTLRREFGCG